jgi:hypothetical protein
MFTVDGTVQRKIEIVIIIVILVHRFGTRALCSWLVAARCGWLARLVVAATTAATTATTRAAWALFA